MLYPLYVFVLYDSASVVCGTRGVDVVREWCLISDTEIITAMLSQASTAVLMMDMYVQTTAVYGAQSGMMCFRRRMYSTICTSRRFVRGFVNDAFSRCGVCT